MQKIAKASVTSYFSFLDFPCSYMSYCHIFTSSHLHLITSSHLQMLTSLHLHITHLYIFTSLHVHLYMSIFTSLHLYMSHLLSFRQLHTCPSQWPISLYFSSLSGHPSSSSYHIIFYFITFCYIISDLDSILVFFT